MVVRRSIRLRGSQKFSKNFTLVIYFEIAICQLYLEKVLWAKLFILVKIITNYTSEAHNDSILISVSQSSKTRQTDFVVCMFYFTSALITQSFHAMKINHKNLERVSP